MTTTIATQPVPAQVSPERKFSARLQIALAKAARAALPCNAHIETAIPILATADPQEPDFYSDAALFDSARRAIRFAVTRDGSPSRPFYSRFLDKMTLVGLNSSGLSVLDAAAQAGIILALLQRALGSVSTAVLIASCTPSSVPCMCRRPCCSGSRIFTQWRYAVDQLSIAAAAHVRANQELRAALLVKIYGSGRLAEIAKKLELDEDTVSYYHRALLRWLRGARGKGGEPSVVGVETTAWRDAESLLRDHRIVG